jgi:hypothetical protein
MGRYDALYQSIPSPALPAVGPTRGSAGDAQSVQSHEQIPPLPTRPPVRSHRSVERHGRTGAASETLLDEIAEGAPAHRRPTERYSFEIYTDQKPAIEELQYQFRKRTGTKLSSSRIIREAIAAYLPEALHALTMADQRQTTGSAEPSER